MTGFVGVQDVARWVATTGIEKIVEGMVGYLEHDFRNWEGFDKSPRVASHTPLGVIELMPTADDSLYSFKYVNGHPSNPSRGFQTVVAFGMLANVDNGYPVFLSEMTLLTALRTASTSAMAAKALARKDSRVHGMVGTGTQSEFQALGMRAMLGLKDLVVYDVDADAVAKFVRNLKPMGFDITVAADAAEVAAAADVLTTCTADKRHSIILRAEDLKPGTHVSAIGGDAPGKTELEAAALDLGDVFVEFPPQTRIEGEIQAKPADYPVTELWKVIAGHVPGRVSDEQITIFDSVGFAIEDFSALRYLRDSTISSDYVTEIDLIAEPEDPKDLFGLIGAMAPVS